MGFAMNIKKLSQTERDKYLKSQLESDKIKFLETKFYKKITNRRLIFSWLAAAIHIKLKVPVRNKKI